MPSTNNPARRFPGKRVLLIILIWVALVASRRLELVELILLAGVGLSIPIIIELLSRTLAEIPFRDVLNKMKDEPSKLKWEPFLLRMIRLVWFPAFSFLAVALIVSDWRLIVLLLVPFAVLTMLFSLHGLASLVERQWSTTLCLLVAGQFYYPVSAVSLFLWKFEISLFGLPLGIILLTALHFQFAGLVLPILLAQLQKVYSSTTLNILCLSILASIPLVGLGIAGFPLIECVSALLLSTMLMAFACQQLFTAFSFRRHQPLVSSLLMISACSLLVSMPMAMVYAVGEFYEIAWISIPTMISWHGSLNAFGFCFCGLLGWMLNDRSIYKKSLVQRATPNEGL
ncbi:hypothetical protein Pla110_37720 [Polystyrenella longa]|uniref:Uncharacterized protein n=1 Tax=Polystyrenella longa TaxID=2528007 RepID=A0A518CS18_9PLAN|nr:YndJ family transporter [Polystyrenella longa]QDU82019.1 hypothetical protein Pla110_37720 [Polystyrenella longa]